MAYRSTIPAPPPSVVHGNGADDANGAVWRERTRMVLTPTAPPSILGLFGLAGATFVVAAFFAHWNGAGTSQLYLIPFVLVFGGFAQFIAALYGYRARDGLVTVLHGMWGSFWIAYGLLWLLGGTGALVLRTGVNRPELGWWFIPLAAISLFMTFAAVAVSRAMATLLSLLTVASTIAAVGFIGGYSTAVTAAGYVFVAAAAVAFYTAGAMLLESTFRRSVLPIGRVHPGKVPVMEPVDVIEYPSGMPGAHAGQ